MTRPTVLVLLLAALVVPARASAFAPGTTTLVDVPAVGGLPYDGINDASAGSDEQISDDGNLVVFQSNSDALLPEGANRSATHVFVRDLAARTTTLISTTSAGVPLDRGASQPVISGNGNRIAFFSDATNAPLANDFTTRAYVKDLTTGTLTLVSRKTTANGTPNVQGVQEISIDNDGSRVAFSVSDKLDAVVDTNLVPDVYVRDLAADTTELASVGNTNVVSTTGAGEPSISGNGAVVFFRSSGQLIPALDTTNNFDIYARNVDTDATALWSINTAGNGVPNGSSYAPSTNNAGTAVAFQSYASDLLPAGQDTNNRADIFVRAGSNTLVSRPHQSANGQGNGDSSAPVMSGDGLRVGFVSNATNLVADATKTSSMPFVRTLADTTTEYVGRASDGTVADRSTAGITLDLDGSVAVFRSSATNLGYNARQAEQVFARDLTTGTTTPASGPTGAAPPPIGTTGAYPEGLSADGRYVLIATQSSVLNPDNTANRESWVIRDLVAGTTRPIGKGIGGTPINGGGEGAALSADGGTVAISTDATNLIENAPQAGAYAINQTTGAAELVSRASGADGAPADGYAGVSGISDDGRYVAFITSAALDPADTDMKADAYVRDREARTTTLVSRADGPAGAVADDDTYGLSLSGDGRHAGFISAGNLAPGAAGNDQKAYVRHLDTGQTVLVGRATGADGAVADSYANPEALNRDGTKAYFTTQAGNLGDGSTGTNSAVFERDLVANTTRLLSRVGPDGPAADGELGGIALSGDGKQLLINSDAPNLGGGGMGRSVVVLRDLATGANTVVSRADGAAGAVLGDAYGTHVNGDGSCVLFGSDAAGVVADGYTSEDYSHVYLRTVSGTCPQVPPVVVEPPPPPPPGGDTVKPVLSKVSLARRTFRAGTKRTAVSAAKKKKKRPEVGTTVRFTLSEDARVTFAVARKTKGRRAGGTCVKQTKKNRKRRACTRWVKVRTLSRAARSGSNRLAFSGRIGSKKLAKASYRMVLVATDAAGNRSAAKTLGFKVVRR